MGTRDAADARDDPIREMIAGAVGDKGGYAGPSLRGIVRKVRKISCGFLLIFLLDTGTVWSTVAHGKRMTSGTPDSWQAQGAPLGPGEGPRVRAGISLFIL